jgi:hypothetical protein
MKKKEKRRRAMANVEEKRRQAMEIVEDKTKQMVVLHIKRYFGAIPNRLAMVSYIYRIRVQVTGEIDVDSHTYNDRSPTYNDMSPNTITTMFNTPPQS